MLSKKVKRRRRLNRLVRKMVQPWRFCMVSYKKHQISLAQLQLRSIAHMTDIVERQVQHRAISDHIARIRYDMGHMTKEQWYKEVEKISGRIMDPSMMRVWAKLILES